MKRIGEFNLSEILKRCGLPEPREMKLTDATISMVLGHFKDKVNLDNAHAYVLEFNQAAEDLGWCASCNGECKSSLKEIHCYYDFYKKSIAQQLNDSVKRQKKIKPQLAFAAHKCKDYKQRKALAIAQLSGKSAWDKLGGVK